MMFLLSVLVVEMEALEQDLIALLIALGFMPRVNPLQFVSRANLPLATRRTLPPRRRTERVISRIPKMPR